MFSAIVRNVDEHHPILNNEQKRLAHELWDELNRASSEQELEDARAKVLKAPIEVQAALLEVIAAQLRSDTQAADPFD